MYSQLKSYLSHSKVSQKLLLMLLTTSLVTAVIVLFTTYSIWRFVVHTQIETDFESTLKLFIEQQPNINEASQQLTSLKKLNPKSIELHQATLFNEQGKLVSYTGAKPQAQQLHQLYAFFLNQTSYKPHIIEITFGDGSHYTLLTAYKYQINALFNGKFFLMVVALLLTAILLIRIIQMQSKRWLIEPILHLKAVTHQVSAHQNYSVRANKVYFDEIGNLVDAFNTMLSQIQARDQLLTDARDKANRAQKTAETSSIEITKTNLRLEEEARVRSAMERKLLEFQDFLNGIINSMPSMLIALTPRYRVTLWNKKAEQLSSIPAGQAINHRIDDVFPNMLFYLDLVHQASTTATTQNVSQAEFKIAGETRYFSIMIYPLNESGLEDVVIKLDDITDEKHLQELVVQSEKMMSLGGLAAGMAHEINNPLGGILQNIQNLTRRLSPGLPKNQQVADSLGLSMYDIEQYLKSRDIPDLIDNITRAGHRAVDIVTNMLQFSRNADPKLEICDITELTKQALEIAKTETTFNELQQKHGLTIREHYREAIPGVPCIQSEIEQVIINLLKNAAQVLNEHGAPTGTPEIHLSVKQQDNYAVIEVRDNGIGMDDRTRRKVFDPFFTTKEIGKGTGLGLSVSYFIISSHHHGLLDVSSEPGKGACFTIKLPFRSLRIQDQPAV
ncbi:HAMP domain-containing sensor histidine kinase [Litoribrevibacter albus]|uniref:histidine kinase n=1 Tax=Litoribrevibacter albus TaxID=1473156 RepID=A0AA37S809_9GAMM|nr:HAMP domain-containing sensor histidine kinase [Litoribrevibacter albus]GLQ29703.1 PAS domain-containing sensor histidine kinase [Litoribrevibacter albus]